MRRTRALLAALTGVAASAVSPAAAQDESGGYLDLGMATFRVADACVQWVGGSCLAGFPEGGEYPGFFALRLGYRSPARWSAEFSLLAGSRGEPAPVPLQLAPSTAIPPKTPPREIEDLDVRLFTLTGTWSFLRTGPLDLFASGGAGWIDFEEPSGFPRERMRDLVTTVGGGALVHLWRIFFLRGDLRHHLQWCSDRDREGLSCGETALSHLEASAGVQMVFHPYDHQAE